MIIELKTTLKGMRMSMAMLVLFFCGWAVSASEETRKPVEPNTYTIVVWGDSIAVQGGAWADAAQTLIAVVANPGRPVKFIKSAQCGLPAAAANKQFAEKVKTFSPDLVVIQFGFNDLRYDGSRPNLPISTPAEYGQHLEQMIRLCQNECKARVLILGNHEPVVELLLPSGRTYREAVADYRAQAEAAAKRTLADYLDMSSAAKRYGVQDKELVVNDGVHLTPFGIQVYAQTVSSWIVRLLTTPAPQPSAMANP